MIKRDNNKIICTHCNLAARVYRNLCRQCAREYKKKNREKNYSATVEGRIRYNLKYKYGITIAEKHLMLLEQQFKCAACDMRLNPDKKKKAIHIDHCHKTNKVRGILCLDCNLSLGRLNEDPVRIRKLAAYIERFKT